MGLGWACGGVVVVGDVGSLGGMGATMLSSSIRVGSGDGRTRWDIGVGLGMWFGSGVGMSDGMSITGAILSFGGSFGFIDWRPWRLACM